MIMKLFWLLYFLSAMIGLGLARGLNIMMFGESDNSMQMCMAIGTFMSTIVLLLMGKRFAMLRMQAVIAVMCGLLSFMSGYVVVGIWPVIEELLRR